VESPAGRLIEKLWREQNALWPLEKPTAQTHAGQLAPVST
jgi:hypothetical protein